MPPDPDSLTGSLSLDWSSLPHLIKPEITEAVRAGVAQAVTSVSSITTNLIQEVNQTAQDWASDHSAELVGKKYDEEGNLVDNPDARWNISDTTRDMLNSAITTSQREETTLDGLMAAIDESGVFSEDRALMIARTEVNRAELGGNVTAFKAMGMDGDEDLYDWVNGEGACEECQGYEDNGPYTLDEIQQLMDDTHPHCRCGFVPHFDV